ncbi:MAG: single-stranded DNA-binding protein [Nocardioides sp.]
MNDTQITFCGWVGSDVTLTQISSGAHVATFRVGTTPRRYRDGRWEDAPTAWHTVKAWRALAEHVHASVRNGDPVVIQGRVVADVWDRPDGTTSTRHVVVATSVGHDLNRGTAAFTKVLRPARVAVDESPAQEVIHSYDEAGPALDLDGAPVADTRGLGGDQPPAEVIDPAA